MSVLGNFTLNGDRTATYSGSGGPTIRTNSRAYDHDQTAPNNTAERPMTLGRRLSSAMGFHSNPSPTSPISSTTQAARGGNHIDTPMYERTQETPQLLPTMRRYGAEEAIVEGDEPASSPRGQSLVVQGEKGFTEHRNSSSTVAPSSPIDPKAQSGHKSAYTPATGGARTEEDVEAGIANLARQMSRQVSRAGTAGAGSGGVAGNVFDYEEGSDLDPYSKAFDAKKWVRSLQRLSEEDDGTAQRTSGVAYKGMSVHGFGSDAGTSMSLFKSRVDIRPEHVRRAELMARLSKDRVQRLLIGRLWHPEPGHRSQTQGANLEWHRRRTGVWRDARRTGASRIGMFDVSKDNCRRDERYLLGRRCRDELPRCVRISISFVYVV